MIRSQAKSSRDVCRIIRDLLRKPAALLAVAILLLQVSRRLAIPYPAMLAAAGVALALIPGTPQIALDPHTALALFIAPALVDAAFDFPVGAVRRFWRPLFALAVVAVMLSAGAVAVARRRAGRAAALCRACAGRDRRSARCGGRHRHPRQRQHAAPARSPC